MQLGQVSPRQRAMSGLVYFVTIVLPKNYHFVLRGLLRSFACRG